MARPVALVFGFAFMFYIMNIAFWFAAMGLGIFLSGMLSDVIMGPGAFVGTLAIIMSTIFMIVRYTLKMITHLPDNLPRWMGGMGNNVGDTQAAEGANQSTASTSQNIARGGSQALQSASKGARDQGVRNNTVEAEAEKRTQDAEKAAGEKAAADQARESGEQQRHNELVDVLRSFGQGEKGGDSPGGGQVKPE